MAIRLDDEGVKQGYINVLNFTGAGVSASKSGITGTITISSGGHTIQDEGVSLTSRTKLNFVGSAVSVTDGGAGPDSTIVTITAGSGDVVGPAFASNTAIAKFSGTTGKIIANTAVLIDGSNNLVPGSNSALDLGSPSLQWRNLYIPTSTSSAGIIFSAGARFIHNYGSAGATSHNTFLGATAGNFSNSGAVENAGFGYNSLVALSSGDYNLAVGSKSLTSLDTGSSNTAAGYLSLGRVTSGIANVGVGTLSGFNSIITGSSNILIGSEADATSDVSNSTVIGTSTSATASNQIVIGGTTAQTEVYFGKGVVSTSAGTDFTIQPTGGSGTDNVGTDLILASGKSTGSGTPGTLFFKTPTAGASGTTLQSLTERLRINGVGAWGLAGANYGTSGQVLASNGSGSAPTWQTVSGTGDVVGPGSSTDNALARFDGTTGKLIQNSTALLDDTGHMALNTAVSTSMLDIVGDSNQTALHVTGVAPSDTIQTGILFDTVNGAGVGGAGLGGRIAFRGEISTGSMWTMGGVKALWKNATSGSQQGDLVLESLSFAGGITEHLRISGKGEWGIDGENFGTSGQVITSNGAGSSPSWQTPTSGSSATDYATIFAFMGG